MRAPPVLAVDGGGTSDNIARSVTSSPRRLYVAVAVTSCRSADLERVSAVDDSAGARREAADAPQSALLFQIRCRRRRQEFGVHPRMTFCARRTPHTLRRCRSLVMLARHDVLNCSQTSTYDPVLMNTLSHIDDQ